MGSHGLRDNKRDEITGCGTDFLIHEHGLEHSIQRVGHVSRDPVTE